uniref:Renin receptor n=1 Tax=Petromyzon marinus TaxID=7757 RepID=A0AAJ7WZ87_PETMA|nr:renin receptor [Petromyzon marinus]
MSPPAVTAAAVIMAPSAAPLRRRRRLLLTAALAALVLLVQGAAAEAPPPSDGLLVLRAPAYVSLAKEEASLPGDRVGDLVSLAMGFSVEQELPWGGLAAGDVFLRPRAFLLLSLLGADERLLPKAIASYRVAHTVPVDLSWVSSSLESSFGDDSLMLEYSPMHQFMYGFGKAFSQIAQWENLRPRNLNTAIAPGSSLNVTVQEDAEFLLELRLLHEFAKAVASASPASPAVVAVELGGLLGVVRRHGDGSAQAEEARSMLGHAVAQFAEDVAGVWGGEVVVAALTVATAPEPSLRKGRSALQLRETQSKMDMQNPYNLAYRYNYNYAVVFNIVLWLMLAMALAIIAVSYGMWNMDPGRDSLIYRMTNQRLKAD